MTVDGQKREIGERKGGIIRKTGEGWKKGCVVHIVRTALLADQAHDAERRQVSASAVAWGCSGISWTMCKQSAPRCRQTTTPTPHHSMFSGRMLFLTPNRVS